MCKLPSLKLVHSNPPLGVLKRSVRSDIESGPRLRSGILGACAVAALAAILPSSFWPFDAVWMETNNQNNLTQSQWKEEAVLFFGKFEIRNKATIVKMVNQFQIDHEKEKN